MPVLKVIERLLLVRNGDGDDDSVPCKESIVSWNKTFKTSVELASKERFLALDDNRAFKEHDRQYQEHKPFPWKLAVRGNKHF
ncbi:hypothetical protein M0R45_023946 [Rubus argutus]